MPRPLSIPGKDPVPIVQEAPPGIIFIYSKLCRHSVFVCVVWISEQRTFICPRDNKSVVRSFRKIAR
jgi:hypothetical protein